MGKGKRNRAGHRGEDVGDRHGTRGRDDERRDFTELEDDPLRDLRPFDEDLPDPAGDEYLWPEMNDEYEEDI